MNCSSRSNPLAARAAASPACFARSACRLDTGKTSGVNPSSPLALSEMKVTTSATSPGRSKMSTLLRTTTIFLPQSRMLCRKARSLSVNGRSAEVTKRTRSERGTNSRVSASCSRRTALVPGVSTMLISRSRPTGAAITSRPAEVTSRATAGP